MLISIADAHSLHGNIRIRFLKEGPEKVLMERLMEEEWLQPAVKVYIRAKQSGSSCFWTR